MEAQILIDSLGRMAGAHKTLAQATKDCADVIDSEIDLLVAASSDPITAGQKKSIKKIAKAMAQNKVKPLSDEAQGMAELLTILIDSLEQ